MAQINLAGAVAGAGAGVVESFLRNRKQNYF